MNTNPKTCICGSCAGSSCTCGCQPPQVDAGCRCGDACSCGPTCNCKRA